MSGSLLPNTTRASASVPYFQPYGGGGGGGGGPNPSFSTITVAGAASVGSLNTPGSIQALGISVDTMNTQNVGSLSSINAPANLAVGCANLSINQGGGNTTTLTNGNLLVPQGITGQAFVGTLNFMSAPILTVSSINGVNFQPPPVLAPLVRIPLINGATSVNGYTITQNFGTEQAITNPITVNQNHLYRISIILDQAQNNDTNPTVTTISITDPTLAILVSYFYSLTNNRIPSTQLTIPGGISCVFQPALSGSIVVRLSNTSASDNSVLTFNNGSAPSYANVGFILEDLGVAP